jgi:hypothetical protein
MICFVCNDSDFRADCREAPKGNYPLWWDVELMQELADDAGAWTDDWRWRSMPLYVDETLVQTRSYRNNFWADVKGYELLQIYDGMPAGRIGDFVWLD